MRINNWRHVPWIIFVLLATAAACVLYAANFHPASLRPWLRVSRSLIQTPTEHHTVGGTPLGLWFGSISLAIFIFAILLSLRKKIPLWRVGTVQRWLRARRADDDFPDGALCHRDDERILWTLPSTCDAAIDEGTVAGRDRVRANPAHSFAARCRRGKDARFI